ncbi:restriction endonuclease subunit S [Sulfuricaulis sp.]|jgi:type I restriction enzyme S subunit|uniref:restriction endonuclease subunit S n=1 Tax=Sulfuricaulis sp. TaxID=2003553 RepID=UPI003559D17C
MRHGQLGDFVQFAYGKGLPARDRKPGLVPVFGSAGCVDTHDVALVKGPGVIVGRKGTVGAVHWSDSDFYPIDTTYYVLPKDTHLRLRYVYYLLKTLPLPSMNTDVAVPGLNRTNALSLKVAIATPSTQDRIIDTLNAYDDLIENNRRRIQLLEQAARLLYQEWFVHLCYPGHEHVKIKDGVPEGWEKAPISNFCTVGRGGSPRPINDYLDGTVPWFKIGDATASESPFVFSTAEKIIEDGVKKSVMLQPLELILSNSATCGIPYFTGITGCIHDGWLYFKQLKRISKWFFYCCLFEKQREILAGIGEGATQKNLNTDYIGRQIVLLPKEQGLLAAFDDTVEPLFSQIFTLAHANIKLSQARGLLLPRLMNGEVAV